jgi:hypothetical protein
MKKHDVRTEMEVHITLIEMIDDRSKGDLLVA